MTRDEEAFIDAIIAAPDDDLPRLIYADWLEEHGRPERAELIRVQCELAKFRVGDPAAAVLTHRATELADRVREWADELKSRLPANRLTTIWFRRGMPTEVECTARYFCDHAEAMFRAMPIQAVTLRRLSVAGVAALASNPSWCRIIKVSIYPDEMTAPILIAFLGLPLAHLRRLSLSSPFGYAPIAAPPGWGERSAEKVVRLAECPQLSGLQCLELDNAGIGVAGAAALIQSAHLTSLHVLRLRGHLLAEPVEHSLRERFSDRVILNYGDNTRLTYGHYYG